MPIDDRLRRGLRDQASGVEPDIEKRLEEVVSGSQGGQPGRWPMVLAYAVVIGSAVIFAPFGLGLLPGGPAPGSSSEPSAVASARPSCPVPVEGVIPNPPGDCLGPLVAGGSYRSSAFIPPLDYTIPADAEAEWSNAGDVPGAFSLNPSGDEGWNAVFLFRDLAPLEPTCGRVLADEVAASMGGFANWLLAHPGLTVTDRQTAEVGGLSGMVLDLAASGSFTTLCPELDPPPPPYQSGDPLLPLFTGLGSAEVTWWISPEERIRMYVLDLPGGGTVVISIDAITTGFDTLVEVSEPVIDTFVFDPDYY